MITLRPWQSVCNPWFVRSTVLNNFCFANAILRRVQNTRGGSLKKHGHSILRLFPSNGGIYLPAPWVQLALWLILSKTEVTLYVFQSWGLEGPCSLISTHKAGHWITKDSMERRARPLCSTKAPVHEWRDHLSSPSRSSHHMTPAAWEDPAQPTQSAASCSHSYCFCH